MGHLVCVTCCAGTLCLLCLMSKTVKEQDNDEMDHTFFKQISIFLGQHKSFYSYQNFLDFGFLNFSENGVIDRL